MRSLKSKPERDKYLWTFLIGTHQVTVKTTTLEAAKYQAVRNLKSRERNGHSILKVDLSKPENITFNLICKTPLGLWEVENTLEATAEANR